MEHVLILDDELLRGGSTAFDARRHRRRRSGSALLLLGTTGLAKGILHAHRYILAHEEFIYCHDVQRRRGVPRHGRVGVGGGDLRRCSGPWR